MSSTVSSDSNVAVSGYVKNVYFASRVFDHFGRVIQSGRKGHERAGSAYAYFKEHGLKITISAADGAEIPQSVLEKLREVPSEPTGPPALGNGKFQKAGIVPVGMSDPLEQGRARRVAKLTAAAAAEGKVYIAKTNVRRLKRLEAEAHAAGHPLVTVGPQTPEHKR